MRVIRNDTEPCICSILLHNPSQSHLRRARHRICLIQDDKLEPGNRASFSGSACGEDLLRARVCLDLLPHDVDATVVGGVQLKNHLSNVLDAVDASCQCKDSGRLARAWWAVEEEVGEAVCVDELVDSCEDVLVAGYVVEGVGAVFFNPRIKSATVYKSQKRVSVPWQAVFCLYGKIGGASFALGGLGRESDVLGGARTVNVHIIFEV